MKKRLVGPIKDDEWLSSFSDYFHMNNERNYVLFMTGVFTGLNMSKVLHLKVGDVLGDYVILRKEGTKSDERVIMHPTLKKVIRRYIRGH